MPPRCASLLGHIDGFLVLPQLVRERTNGLQVDVAGGRQAVEGEQGQEGHELRGVDEELGEPERRQSRAVARPSTAIAADGRGVGIVEDCSSA